MKILLLLTVCIALVVTIIISIFSLTIYLITPTIVDTEEEMDRLEKLDVLRKETERNKNIKVRRFNRRSN